jgi:drug/metabolite transporter (DMT)-like permease
MNLSAVALALASAALFGVSTPLAKSLLGSVDPWLLAGLFYLGSGVGLALARVALPRRGPGAEAALAAHDIPWLVGAILSGGVIGPILLMVGLTRTDGTTASLLLTVEGMATALIAWFAFRENFDRRILAGMGFIVAGAVVLASPGAAGVRDLTGPVAIVGACIAWGLDNNLTRNVSLADPVQVAMIKGLTAGPVNLALGFAGGAALPPLQASVLAAIVGLFGYGVSLVLFVLALRHLGTARTGAYFSTAPFLGAAVSVPLLGEAVSAQLLAAGALMAAGVWLHISERHGHEHRHERVVHTHRHVHDEHHRHGHDHDAPAGEPHSHEHAHVPLVHSHPHAPDSHHRHRH